MNIWIFLKYPNIWKIVLDINFRKRNLKKKIKNLIKLELRFGEKNLNQWWNLWSWTLVIWDNICECNTCTNRCFCKLCNFASEGWCLNNRRLPTILLPLFVYTYIYIYIYMYNGINTIPTTLYAQGLVNCVWSSISLFTIKRRLGQK